MQCAELLPNLLPESIATCKSNTHNAGQKFNIEDFITQLLLSSGYYFVP
ncbi:hypothetical protein SALWKB29_1345 [Snodgrassella communis]|uniref:Uncharacterized protein n=1 Tax=Snodgrassella communis TaxID=2946699 RepID=A0A836MQZ6_9NEIS|nr:hypothetical protein SALWKB29_1345 [Snodgrassella communis]